MKRDLLPLLRCPFDRETALSLLALSESDAEVLEGALVCPECRRWFAILDGVPHLVRDGLRLVELEMELLNKYSAQLPPEAAAWRPYGPGADL